jgi:hypothetical protein
MLLAGSAVTALAACNPDLAVTNPNNADITRALARPGDVETLISGGFNSVANATTGGSNENLTNSFQVMSLMNGTTLANFNMGGRIGIPRAPILNVQGNAGSASVINDWNLLHRAARTSVLGQQRLSADGFTLGSAAQDIRARAFARFTNGLALGYLAMAYDSAAVVVLGGDPVPPLVRYDSVGRAALTLLDSALADASNPAIAGQFPLPQAWLNTTVPATQDLFVRMIRSLRARVRASIARTPAERAAVNWALVIADAQNGVTADVSLSMNPATGWSQAWIIQHFQSSTWHTMPYWIIGMADRNGERYATWLNSPLTSRAPFLIETADRRFPVGANRTEQNTNSAGGVNQPLPATQYFRNRVAGQDGDAAASPLTFSFYDHARFQAFFTAGRIGAFPYITRAEMDMLRAEGLIRTNDINGAAALIDIYRTRAGLPALAGVVTNLTTPVPGGADCVPRIPVRTGTGPYTTTCGNILEAMKWEKRIETAFINYGAWFFDMRGWGDLPEGTPIAFPVPWQEFQSRVGTPVNYGGVGLNGGAPRGTYGFP